MFLLRRQSHNHQENDSAQQEAKVISPMASTLVFNMIMLYS